MSSYASTYVTPEKALIRTLAQTHSHFTGSLYRYLADSADDYGACYPGLRHLANVLNSNTEAVQAALDQLVAMGVIAYVRRSVRDRLTGQYLPNVYQINPALLHIRPELEAQAWQQWMEAGGQPLTLSGNAPNQPVDAPGGAEVHREERASLSDQQSPVRQLCSAPDRTNNRTSDSLTSSNSKGYNQQQQTTPEVKPSLSDGQAVVVEKTHQEKGEKDQKKEKKQKNSANMGCEKPQVPPKAERPTQPIAKKPETSLPYQQQRSGNQEKFRTTPAQKADKPKPNYAELIPVREALSDELLEGLAERVKEEAPMPIMLARGLIVQYGWNTVEAALNHPSLKKAYNPGGLLRWLVQGGHIDPELDTGYDPLSRLSNGKRYVSGPYADFIQH